MRSMKRFIFTLGALALTTIVAGAAWADDAPVLDRILKNGEIRVGMSGNQPPLNTRSRSGGLIGLEVDLAKQLSAAMGVKLKIVDMPFGDLLTTLEKGDVDIVMSGVSITASRTEKFAFAGPYMMSGKSILTKSATLAGAKGSEDIDQPDFSFAALENSTSEEFVKLNLPKAKLVTIKDYDEGVKMVMDDKVDALVADMPICVLSVMRYPDAGLVTLKRPMTVEPIGIAVPASDPQLLNLLDNYLDALEGMGYMQELRKTWLQDGSWIAALP
jgi:polar amino acid transport system substrate-binding protein